MTETSDRLRCVVVTPEREVLDEGAEFVVLPLYDGELGVLPGHAAIIGQLGYGELRITKAGNVRRLYIDGGFAQVRADTVTVLTPKAIPSIEIDVSAAQSVVNGPAVGKERERALGQLRTAEAAKRAGESLLERASHGM